MKTIIHVPQMRDLATISLIRITLNSYIVTSNAVIPSCVHLEQSGISSFYPVWHYDVICVICVTMTLFVST